MEENIKILHYCTRMPQMKVQEVIIDSNGWASSVIDSDLNFPVYKSCCHFYHLNILTGEIKEVDYSNVKPKLC